MRRFASALFAAALLGPSAAPAAPTVDGFIDPPQRSEYAPRGPLRVIGGITPISAVNANDVIGFAQLGEFAQVTIRGVVQVPSGTLDPWDQLNTSNWFYVNDGTGGVVVTRPNLVNVSVAAGDSVEVHTSVFTQRLAPVQGTRTLDLTQGFGDQYVTKIPGSRPLVPARAVTADSVAASGAALEGELVQLTGLTLVSSSEWPLSGASGFVRATDGVDTVRVYIDEDTDLDGISPPAGSFNLTGFVSQNDPSGTTYLTGYFVYPRSTADLSQGDGSGTATVTPTTVTEGATGVSLAFTVTGQEATLETVEVEIPSTWTWASPGDLVVSGSGFAGAGTSFAPSGSGGWVVTVTGAAVDAVTSGTLTLGSLTAPSLVEFSRFVVRTATPAGSPAEIPDSPVVQVASSALPGEVVINELYPRTLVQAQGLERSEFIELHNRTPRDLVIGGWSLSDIGRTPNCTLDSRWAFPLGTILPAGGFAVVCQTARDPANGAGFLVDFPSVPPSAAVFEMFDAGAGANVDDPATPNMVLLDPTTGNDQIKLLGGPDTNVGQCESPDIPGLFLPFEELVVLKNAFGGIIDAVEFREPGPCTQDLCGPSDPAGTGTNDAYPYGPPKVRHTLGRDAVSTDTDDSAADLRPSSTPTPGDVNVPVDTDPPTLSIPATNVAVSASILELRFDEPVEDALATDPANYTLSLGTGGGTPVVHEVLGDPSQPLTHYFLVTDPLVAGGAVTLTVSGITDIAFGGAPGNVIDTTIVVPVPSDAFPICTVQESDASGFSPMVGDTVLVAGYITILPTSVDRFSIWVQEPGESGCGVNVFSFDAPPDRAIYGLALNDLVVIHGRVTEFISSTSGSGSVTELSSFGNSDFYRFLVRGLDGPEPRVRTTGASNDEGLEGTLVRTEGTVVNSNALAAWIDDGTGAVQVFQNFSALDLTRFTLGDRLNVTGVITQFDATEPFFEGYELVPQTQESLVKVEGDFSEGTPRIRLAKRVLAPQLGERMDITVNTPRRADVIVEIYDSVGRKITTFYDGIGLGEMKFQWDGRGQDGAVVPPGVYLCHVRATALDGGSVVKDTAPIVVGLPLSGGEVAR